MSGKGLRTATWLLFGVNMLFLAANCAVMIILLLENTAAMGKSGSVPDTTGMVPYMAKSPFSLLVNEDFPDNDSFLLHRAGRELTLILEDESLISGQQGPTVARQRPKKYAVLSLGDGFDVTIDFSYREGQEYDIKQVMLTKTLQDKYDMFVDYLADGSYDLHMQMNRQTFIGRNAIMLNGEWQEVEEVNGPYRRVLANGDKVEFDLQVGKWIRVDD